MFISLHRRNILQKILWFSYFQVKNLTVNLKKLMRTRWNLKVVLFYLVISVLSCIESSGTYEKLVGSGKANRVENRCDDNIMPILSLGFLRLNPNNCRWVPEVIPKLNNDDQIVKKKCPRFCFESQDRKLEYVEYTSPWNRDLDI